MLRNGAPAGPDRFIHLRGRPGDAWRLHFGLDAAVHYRRQRSTAATWQEPNKRGVKAEWGAAMGFTKKWTLYTL